MVGMKHDAGREAIARELLEKAAELWGQERADQLRRPIEEVAGYLSQVAENLPQREEEPAFFF